MRVDLTNYFTCFFICRKFVFFNIPQIQYKNPWVQIMMFKNMTPSPFLKFYLGVYFLLLFTFEVYSRTQSGLSHVPPAGDGEQVLVDVEGKDYKQISQHVKKILGKTE